MNRWMAGLLLGLGLGMPATNAAADQGGAAEAAVVSREEFAELKQDFAMLLERFEDLAAENAQLRSAQQQTQAQVAAVEDANDATSWAERIGLSGDFRYRYQGDETSGNLASALGDDDSRNRQRIRARAAVKASLPADVEVGLGFASGGDDPVSTNQTLGDGGSTKDINLDLAYFAWTGLDDTAIRGGKVKNTLVTAGGSQLQWDGDWRPEGADVRWDNGTFFGQFLGTWLESDSDRANTEFSYLVQAGARAQLGGISLTGGVGYTEIDAAGSPCFFDDDDFGLCGGNQVDAAGNYLYDFEVFNVFAEAGFMLAGLPVSVFADFVTNDAADDFDTGYLVGTQLGEVGSRGSWQLQYYYASLESNATLGLLTNSDFGGGGTNGEGSVFSGAYALTDATSVQLTYFLVDRNTDGIPGILGGEEFDLDTLQLDFNFRYR